MYKIEVSIFSIICQAYNIYLSQLNVIMKMMFLATKQAKNKNVKKYTN